MSNGLHSNEVLLSLKRLFSLEALFVLGMVASVVLVTIDAHHNFMDDESDHTEDMQILNQSKSVEDEEVFFEPS